MDRYINIQSSHLYTFMYDIFTHRICRICRANIYQTDLGYLYLKCIGKYTSPMDLHGMYKTDLLRFDRKIKTESDETSRGHRQICFFPCLVLEKRDGKFFSNLWLRYVGCLLHVVLGRIL